MPAECSSLSKLSVPIVCLPRILEQHASSIPDTPAILAPGRAALTYSRLNQHICDTGRALRAMGIGRCDRVAVVLPNGPELVSAILSSVSCAICAPLNPALGANELDRYFSDLPFRALITQAGLDTPARRMAVSHGLQLVELSVASDAGAGIFTLAENCGCAKSHESPAPTDVALLMLTSGTTSRPKAVPLTHANICASALSAGEALALGENDRCLNVLPLFHGHGLVATVLTSLVAGASVVCTPGCDVTRFFGWLTEFRPTWYSAVPTMHQAILLQARQSGVPTRHRLRLIRSASAPLPPATSAELERTFDAPVIEFYGMTETASAPIACNPLPPRRRKAGSVGVQVGLQVAILDGHGAALPNGHTGQVVVRGASVMAGYDADAAATQAAFAGDWFKTGDHGYFDEEGYLFLVGRKQEIINRGGEKIAPREVEEVLLEHPAVAEAVVFGIPHTTLGEDVAAAVVLRPHAMATSKEIRRFILARIANFKAPRQLVIVDEIPKGPSGKLQRAGIGEKFGLTVGGVKSQAFSEPRTPLERLLAENWAEILQVEQVGIHDDFFALGGDSLLVAQIIARIYESVDIEIDVTQFFEAPTIAETAQYVETRLRAGQIGQSSPILPVPQAGIILASIYQEQIFKFQRLLPGRPLFNVFCPLQLNARCDPAILEQSINELVQRHGILRTTFAQVNGKCVQVIAPQLRLNLNLDDVDSLPNSENQDIGVRLIQEEALHSFDLMQGPLLRARLVRVGEREHLLLITIHGIIIDAWSLGVLVAELFTLNDAFSAARPSPLPLLPIQFADFAHWQRHWQSHPEIAVQLTYWQEQLRDPVPPNRLSRGPAVAAVEGFRTTRREVKLPLGLTEAARRFSVQEGGTLYMVLVAALMTLLRRYLGQDDLCVASLVANRNRPGTDRLVGPLANTVILRVNLGGDPSFREVMRRVRKTTLAAFSNQDLPFEELVATLARERSLEIGSLASVMIALHNSTMWPKMHSGFEEANSNPLGGALLLPNTFELSFMLRESSEGVTGFCVYKPHLFNEAAIGCLLHDLEDVLQSTVAQADRPISQTRISFEGKGAES